MGPGRGTLARRGVVVPVPGNGRKGSGRATEELFGYRAALLQLLSSSAGFQPGIPARRSIEWIFHPSIQPGIA